MFCFQKYCQYFSKHWQPSCSRVFECDAIAWDSVIYKRKLLCGSINEHGM